MTSTNEFIRRRLKQLPIQGERIASRGVGKNRDRVAYVSRVLMGQTVYTRVEVANDIYHYPGELAVVTAARKGFSERKIVSASQALL